MGGKKKSRGNKLAAMSEEEKARYLQQRAAAEEEARRRKEHLLSVFIKNKLKHEDTFSRLNSAKINQDWRQTLRQLKNKELQEAAETLHQTFDVAIQTKNKIIATLLEDLGNSLSLHTLAVQTHLEFVNKIIGMSASRLETLEAGYKLCREEKLVQAEDQTTRAQQTYLEDKEKLSLDSQWQIFFHQHSNQSVELLSEDYRNDYKYKALSEVKKEEEEGAKKINDLQVKMKQTLKTYRKSLSPFIKHYQKLENLDKKETDSYLKNKELICHVENKLQKADYIRKLSDKYLKDCGKEFTRLLQEKKILFHLLRVSVRRERMMGERDVKGLSATSGAALKGLESRIKTLTIIINSRNAYKKHLAENEYHFLPHIGMEEEEKNEQDDETWHHKTTSFWKLYSEVRNEGQKISENHTSLLDENTSLQHSLKKCINTLSRPSNLTRCVYRDIT